MRTVEIPDLKLTYNIPETLGECSKKEYLSISYLIFMYLNGSVSYEEFRIHAITKLMNIKVSEAFSEDIDIHSNIYLLSELMSSYFEDTEDGSKKIVLDFLQIKIPSIKIGLATYYGPEESLFTLTYGEFADASRVFDEFHSSGDVHCLYLLAAILYRKRKPFTKERTRYNSKKIDKAAKHFTKHTSSSFIYGVYLQFTAFRQYLPVAEIPWGGQVLNFEILFENEETSETTIPGIGAESMVFSLAESGVFGSTENVRNTNFLEIMIHLYDLRKRDIENQKKENAKSK